MCTVCWFLYSLRGSFLFMLLDIGLPNLACGKFLEVSHALYPKGTLPQRSSILGFSFTYAYRIYITDF